MKFLLFLLLLLFSCLSPSSSSSRHQRRHHHHRPTPNSQPILNQTQTVNLIQQACKATRFPETCKAQLGQSAHIRPGSGPIPIIQSAIYVSAQNLNSTKSMLRDMLAASVGNRNRTQAAETCLEVLGYSHIRSSAATLALARGSLNNARAWFTAALAYQYDCWGGLKYVNDTDAVRKTMSFMNDTLIVSTSNALSMVVALDDIGADPSSWVPPRTERAGFWETRSGSAGSGDLWFGGDVGAGLTANATVCKAGCDHDSVQRAVDAAPANLKGGLSGERYVIHIKEGVYEEIVRVGFEKRNLVFLGDGIGRTVITGSVSTGLKGITTYKTATVGVLGDGFMAKGLTIQNTAGPNARQAVAYRSDSDLSMIESCEFLGNQDTLYVHSLRQLFKSCLIQGNVDFVFGNAAAVFQNCTLLFRPRQEPNPGADTNCVAAHGRTDPAQSTGFVFLGCVVNGTEDFTRLYNSNPAKQINYLGRPWKEFSRIVYIDCFFEGLVNPMGWLHWDGEFALKTLYFGEYGNKGPSANLSKRVPWMSVIPAQHVNAYSAKSFLLGDEKSTKS